MKKTKAIAILGSKSRWLKMNNIILKEKLKQNLMKLNKEQFKIFWGMLVHYWLPDRLFISNQNFLNLWCELNLLCYQSDESFPSPYDDHNLIKSFCEAHPYYFIDILPLETVAKLFAEYCDEHLDVLARVVRILSRQGSRAAHRYIMVTFCLDHTLDELVSDSEEHIEAYS